MVVSIRNKCRTCVRAATINLCIVCICALFRFQFIRDAFFCFVLLVSSLCLLVQSNQIVYALFSFISHFFFQNFVINFMLHPINTNRIKILNLVVHNQASHGHWFHHLRLSHKLNNIRCHMHMHLHTR